MLKVIGIWWLFVNVKIHIYHLQLVYNKGHEKWDLSKAHSIIKSSNIKQNFSHYLCLYLKPFSRSYLRVIVEHTHVAHFLSNGVIFRGAIFNFLNSFCIISGYRTGCVRFLTFFTVCFSMSILIYTFKLDFIHIKYSIGVHKVKINT